MTFLKKAIKSGKDMTISSAVKIFAEKYISGFAVINAIEIDSSQKLFTAEVVLKGEKDPISLKVARYEIISEGARHLFVPHNVSASRQWLDILAKEYLEDHAFEIPGPLARALKIMV